MLLFRTNALKQKLCSNVLNAIHIPGVITNNQNKIICVNTPFSELAGQPRLTHQDFSSLFSQQGLKTSLKNGVELSLNTSTLDILGEDFSLHTMTLIDSNPVDSEFFHTLCDKLTEGLVIVNE